MYRYVLLSQFQYRHRSLRGLTSSHVVVVLTSQSQGRASRLSRSSVSDLPEYGGC